MGTLSEPWDKYFCAWVKPFQAVKTVDEALVVVDLHAAEILLPTLLAW
jgi:hypothetical protein